MPRFIALILMLIVPLQFAWAAVAGVYGHVGQAGPSLGMHVHHHDHVQYAHHDDLHGSLHAAGGVSDHGDPDAGHGEDGHHVSHYHPVFSYIPMEPSLSLGVAATGGQFPQIPAVFTSRIPPLPDRPPLTLA